jgi:predicted phosphodiesterase
MLLGIFGDIHGNFEALAAVHQELTRLGCDQVVCLGDVVGYGASPGCCIDFLKQKNIACVKGNHDFFALDREQLNDWGMKDYSKEAILWTQGQLTEEQFAWLESLPFSMKVGGVQFVHSSMETLDGEYWPYIMNAQNAQFHFYLQECQVAFCGHIHVPLLFSCSDTNAIKMEMLKATTLDLNSSNKYLITPGATGQPRDLDWRASAVTYDTESGKLQPVRVEYNVAATQEKILNAGLAADLAERLSNGT